MLGALGWSVLVIPQRLINVCILKPLSARFQLLVGVGLGVCRAPHTLGQACSHKGRCHGEGDPKYTPHRSAKVQTRVISANLLRMSDDDITVTLMLAVMRMTMTW